MLQVNLPVVDTIHPYSNKFATSVKIKATGELKLAMNGQIYTGNDHT